MNTKLFTLQMDTIDKNDTDMAYNTNTHEDASASTIQFEECSNDTQSDTGANIKKDKITIMSIELTNFMCHEHFLIKFEKLVTCIGGRNGTGKSAVMIALGMLFGQRVRTLERGKGYRSVIKNGCNEASISVRINNHRRYKLDKYGREIIVSKILGERAAKIYIGNASGKMRLSKQSEVDGIINAYDLRFENPLNFLTQERSKRFLRASDSETLYEFYYCGTKFKEVDNELDDCVNRVDEMNGRLTQTEERYRNYCEEREIKKKIVEMLSMDFEKQLGKLEKEEKLKSTCEAAMQIDSSITKLMEYDNELKKLNKIMKNNVEEEDICDNENKEEVTTELERLSIERRGVENDYNDYCKELERRKADAGDGEGIEVAIKKLEDLENGIRTTEEEIKTLKTNMESAETFIAKERSVNEENKRRRQELMRQKVFLLNNTGNPFGVRDKLREVDEAMKKCQFVDEVIGPVCKYLRLKDMKWCRPVSILIKASLFNYIVFKKEDGLRLQEIFKNVGVNFVISQLSGRSGRKWASNTKEWVTVLDVLECRHIEVQNYLIMMHEIERTILVDNREEAYRIIRERREQVECAYTNNGDRIRLTNGSLSDYRSRDKKYWFDNGTEELKTVEGELGRIVDTNEAEKKYIELNETHKRKKNELVALEDQKRWLQAKIEGLCILKHEDKGESAKKVEELSRKIEILRGRLIQIEKLVEEVRYKEKKIEERNMNAKRELEMNKNKREREKEEIRKRNAYLEIKKAEEIDKLRNLLKIHAAKIKMEDECIEKSNSSMNIVKTTDDLHTIENCDANVYTNNLNTDDKIKNKNNGKAFKEIFEEFDFQNGHFLIEKYKNIFVNTRKMSEILREKIIIKEQQKEAEKMVDSETVIEQLRVLETKTERCSSLIDRYKLRIEEAQEAIKIRLLKREEIKHIKTTETAEAFRAYMSKNNYDGELIFDHKNHKLDIRVKVHSSDIAGSKDTLSGGERSYAAVCFMTSLWISCNCPVKVLDEFDVFMDVINRRTTVKTLLDYFKSTRTQGILITPLNTEDIIDNDSQIVTLEKLYCSD